jgi:hypothetical protein
MPARWWMETDCAGILATVLFSSNVSLEVDNLLTRKQWSTETS